MANVILVRSDDPASWASDPQGKCSRPCTSSKYALMIHHLSGDFNSALFFFSWRWLLLFLWCGISSYFSAAKATRFGFQLGVLTTAVRTSTVKGTNRIAAKAQGNTVDPLTFMQHSERRVTVSYPACIKLSVSYYNTALSTYQNVFPTNYKILTINHRKGGKLMDGASVQN